MSEERISSVTATVVQGKDGGLVLNVPRRSACKSCSKDDGCGMSMLGGLTATQGMKMELNPGVAQVGDTLELGCSQDGLVKAAFIAYAPPALGLVLGASAAALNGGGDGVQALGALGGLMIGLLCTRGLAAKSRLPKMHILKGASS